MSRPSADTPLNWSDLGVIGLLPTGTVTLLLADVEGSTRLWEAQPEAMTAAIAVLDNTLTAYTGARYHSTAPPLPGAPLIAVSEVEIRIGVALTDLHAA
jgi:hypothetical protein